MAKKSETCESKWISLPLYVNASLLHEKIKIVSISKYSYVKNFIGIFHRSNSKSRVIIKKTKTPHLCSLQSKDYGLS
uniref:Uncharacterized protein n=1 Tax=Solanum lycopersicum TaxID=4081 RepID=A0A3Q7HMN9_SOLLC